MRNPILRSCLALAMLSQGSTSLAMVPQESLDNLGQTQEQASEPSSSEQTLNGFAVIGTNMTKVPSCRVIEKRILYASVRTEEERAIVQKAVARGKLSDEETKKIKRLLERHRSENQLHRNQLIDVRVIWGLVDQDPKVLTELDTNFETLRKWVVAGNYDWDAQNGVLPDELKMQWLKDTRLLILDFQTTLVDLCFGMSDVRVVLGQEGFLVPLVARVERE